MSLWGAAPVLVIALLGGAGHPGLVHDGSQPLAAVPSAAAQPIVARNIPLFEYLVVPALTGLAMVALLLLLILFVVEIYGWDGSRTRPFLYRDTNSPGGKKTLEFNRDFWVSNR